MAADVARLLRGYLGIPKVKGSTANLANLAASADDPPWPDVRIVVCVNKRSGGRVVGRPAVDP